VCVDPRGCLTESCPIPTKKVADERGQLSAMTGTSVVGGPASVGMLQPRTYGLSVDMSF